MATLGRPTEATAGVLEEPAWDVARLSPLQGSWSESEYLRLTDDTNWLVEFTHGRIEVLPLPTTSHQRILLFLLDALRAFVKPRKLGEVLFAPLRVRVGPGKFREPDIVFLHARNVNKSGEHYWEGCDLAVEIVSPDDPERDRVEKRADYAEAGIPEYWIVDPLVQTVTVLALEGATYRVHGEFRSGERATSALLDGFEVDVATVFAQASLS